MCTSARLLQFQIELCRFLLKTTGHNAKYPIMHYFSTYGHIWSMKACMILTDSCWGFNPKLHCGNVDIMPYQKNIFRVLGAYYVDQVWDRLQAVDKKQKTKLNEHNRYACIPQQRQPLWWFCKKATCNVIHQFSSCWYYVSWELPPLICAGLVYCHCTGRRAVLDNTHGKEGSAFRWGLLYSHYHGPYFYLTEDIMFHVIWCICSDWLTHQSSCCWLVSKRSCLGHGVR